MNEWGECGEYARSHSLYLPYSLIRDHGSNDEHLRTGLGLDLIGEGPKRFQDEDAVFAARLTKDDQVYRFFPGGRLYLSSHLTLSQDVSSGHTLLAGSFLGHDQQEFTHPVHASLDVNHDRGGRLVQEGQVYYVEEYKLIAPFFGQGNGLVLGAVTVLATPRGT
jgi:hypothetical protein